jgi:hypothetical protein
MAKRCDPERRKLRTSTDVPDHIVVWRVDWRDNELGRLIWWEPTKAGAASYADALRDDKDVESVSVRPMRVPTVKKQLIEWLNTHVTVDNG